MSNTKFSVAYSLWAVLLFGCTNQGDFSDRDPAGRQKLSLTVAISQVGSKAPITGTAFTDGTHLFGLAITEENEVGAYEAGSDNLWAQAVVAGATQGWSYKWGAMSDATTVLPLLGNNKPMHLAGYYPYNPNATAVTGRDQGRLNVPFDLTTPTEQSNQTDVMYSPVQTVTYNTQPSQGLVLPFQHVYALLEFQVKLEDAASNATITQVEVCNKAGKNFLSNEGYFSPYTGDLTASTPGNVSLTTSTELNGSTFTTIRIMVPPTLLQDYVDGDIYVQLYDQGSASPKQFPILATYLSTGTYGFMAGGRYTYKLLYDNTALGSLTVVGWIASTHTGVLGGGDILGILPLEGWGFVALDEAPVGIGYPWVEIDGLRWAKGNLIATGDNSCKIGTANDAGLYFAFGSLVGWTGGATGNGVGRPLAALALDKVVWPIEMGATKPTYAWKTPVAPDAGWLPSYCFNYPIKSVTSEVQKDIGLFSETVKNEGSTTGNLRGGRYANLGVGDPCTYYLGTPWRTPTTAEWVTLLGLTGEKVQKTAPLRLTSYELFFPYTVSRLAYTGELSLSPNIEPSQGYRWASSIYEFSALTQMKGGSVSFQSAIKSDNGELPQVGYPVRCVATKM